MKEIKEIQIESLRVNSEQKYAVSLLPGAKVFDVLMALKLEGFALAKSQGDLLKTNDDLYEAVADGERLFVIRQYGECCGA